MPSNLPSVSVVIPARDQGENLPRAIGSVRAQTYPNIIEIIVAAADEATARSAPPGVTVVNNPSGSTPAALNLAIQASRGEVIARCDAQSILPADYVATAVSVLVETGADNVGGMQIPEAETQWGEAIATAMSSRWGAGDARYRIGGEPGPVETVYLGVFRRTALERVGGFDEEFVRTQDYELNHRIIESGGVVWFDPRLKVRYRPRETLPGLARQYFEYGRAKRRFHRKHPRSLRWRQLAAPALVIALIASLLASWVWPWTLLVLAGYLVAIIMAGVTAGRSTLRIAAALAVMHLAWGWGFLSRRSD